MFYLSKFSRISILILLILPSFSAHAMKSNGQQVLGSINETQYDQREALFDSLVTLVTKTSEGEGRDLDTDIITVRNVASGKEYSNTRSAWRALIQTFATYPTLLINNPTGKGLSLSPLEAWNSHPNHTVKYNAIISTWLELYEFLKGTNEAVENFKNYREKVLHLALLDHVLQCTTECSSKSCRMFKTTVLDHYRKHLADPNFQDERCKNSSKPGEAPNQVHEGKEEENHSLEHECAVQRRMRNFLELYREKYGENSLLTEDLIESLPNKKRKVTDEGI